MKGSKKSWLSAGKIFLIFWVTCGLLSYGWKLGYDNHVFADLGDDRGPRIFLSAFGAVFGPISLFALTLSNSIFMEEFPWKYGWDAWCK